MKILKSLFVLILLVAGVSFILSSFSYLPMNLKVRGSNKQDTVLYTDLGRLEKEVDLKGKICQIPQGVALTFNGGLLKNGVLEGNDTRVDGDSVQIFDHIHISGTWEVPYISTKMFVDLSYENALRELISLSDPRIDNIIVIEDAYYLMSVKEESEICISLTSNTTLKLHGVIRLLPNVLKTYSIILVKGDNIKIVGDGTIVGDKDLHTGKTGEWGTGIDCENARNASVEGLTIKDCWGDCIYVGRDSKNIVIKDCIIDNGRRQGISITKADGVTILNCKITNVGGTKPEYAIDLEPNRNSVVDHVLIENVEVVDCVGGFLTTKGKKDVKTKRIGEVVIRNCIISALSKYPLSIKECESILIEGCKVFGNLNDASIYTNNSEDVVIRGNIIYMKDGDPSVNPKVRPIDVVNAKFKKVSDNIVYTYQKRGR